MTAALLTPPTSAAAHAGLVFMDAGGYPSMSGHSVIATATIAIERGASSGRRSQPTAHPSPRNFASRHAIAALRPCSAVIRRA